MDKLERKDKKGVLDYVQEKLVSRKLLVWLTCTGLLLQSKIQSEHYVWISLCYIGSQSIIDFVVTLKSAGK